MSSAFYRKIRGDIGSLFGRLVLLAFAVGVGVLVLAAIAGTASTLLREMARSYEATRPATATLHMEAPVDPSWAESLRGSYGILDARAGGSYRLRFQDGSGRWQPMVLFIVDDPAANRIAAVRPEPSSPWPPRAGTVAVERTALPTFGLDDGDPIRLRLVDGSGREARIGAVVHDPGVAPAYQERTAYGYVDGATAKSWGLEPFTELKVRFDPDLSWQGARDAATALARSLQAIGYAVEDIRVPPPHRHPHQGILVTLILILGSFGFLTVILCSLLVANTVASLLAREKRWIGVMRTLGASTSRVLVLALAPVLFLGIAAVSWSAPVGIFASKVLSASIADLLNIGLADSSVAWWAWLSPIAVGLASPLAVSFFPARAAVGVPIWETLTDVGTENRRYSEKRGPWARFLMRLNPALALAWRNALRKKRRLVLSVSLLGIGGGLFMTAFDLGGSWKALLAESFASRKMDYQARIVGPVDAERVDRLARAMDGAAVERWASVPAAIAGTGEIPVEATYPDEAHGSFRAFAVPAASRMVEFPILSGRGDPAAGEIVLNQTAALRFPGAAVGDSVAVTLAGSSRSFVLAGIVRELGQAAAYLDRDALRAFASRDGYRTELLIALPRGSDRSRAAARLEEGIAEERLPVEVLIDNREFVIGGGEHFALLIRIILALGLVTGTVGWLGIASVLALAVTERRREFGIIRTIGGTPRALLAAIMGEAAAMTVLGAGAAAVLSLPVAYGLGSFLGGLSARMPLPLTVDYAMVGLWLALSLPAGILSSLGAALRASRITVRETLHYV